MSFVIAGGHGMEKRPSILAQEGHVLLAARSSPQGMKLELNRQNASRASYRHISDLPHDILAARTENGSPKTSSEPRHLKIHATPLHRISCAVSLTDLPTSPNTRVVGAMCSCKNSFPRVWPFRFWAFLFRCVCVASSYRVGPN